MTGSADNLIGALVDGLGPEAAAVALAGLVNRAAGRLHALSRAEASAHKGQPEWPAWARLSVCSRPAARLSRPARATAAASGSRPSISASMRLSGVLLMGPRVARHHPPR